MVDGHDEHHVKESSFDGKEPLQGDPHEEATDDNVHEKQAVDQIETKECLEDSHDQSHDPPDDRDTTPLIVTDHDSKLEEKTDEEDTLNVDIHQPNDVDNEHDASKDSELGTAMDPTTQSQGEEDEKQITNVDGNQSDVNDDHEVLPSEEGVLSQEKANDQDLVDVNLSNDAEKLGNSNPGVNDDPETQPSDEGLPSQKETNHQDVTDVNVMTDTENLTSKEKPNPDVALHKAELHKYLESKGLLHQIPAKCEEEKDPQSLETILSEYTALDILDEDNKFICTTCTKNRMFMLLVV